MPPVSGQLIWIPNARHGFLLHEPVDRIVQTVIRIDVNTQPVWIIGSPEPFERISSHAKVVGCIDALID
ncbi:unnamed protein product [Acanthoscelides obtectus]|uniref:Uncharacterized protein n=1 Tax=Acanthoscelides obtectus TaxID=200917 RepID=A0A9P0PRA8_ACAOB|nr:unnamed protein product [Acanthoscelides obtectus]CAK1630189.1 hypothetical protein AOBTE_LOCUS6197 [Acanthoscelides obtectus]